MSERTTFLGRLIGLYCILYPLSMVVHKQASIEAVTGMVQNPALMLLLGVFVLVAGLAIVLGHNIWSGGPLPVTITLVGWASIAKALLFLLLGPHAVSAVMDALHYAQLFYFYMAVSIALGLYLTIAGFHRSYSQVLKARPADAFPGTPSSLLP